MAHLTYFILILITISYCYSSCIKFYGIDVCEYVPAPKYQAPKCAKPGATYCEHPYHYPREKIHQLLEKWKFDHSSLIQSESRDEYFSYYVPNTRESDKFKPKINKFSSEGYNYFSPGNGTPKLLDFENNKHASFDNHGFNFSFFNKNQDESYVPVEWTKRFDSINLFRLRKVRSVNLKKRIYYFNTLDQKNETKIGHKQKRQSTLTSQVLCQTVTNYIMPRAALNNKGNWMYVVNLPEVDRKYSQLVKSETCSSQECLGLCNLPSGYASRCEQKYVQKRLLALEGSGSQLYTDVFWFPSCCICTVSN